MRLSNSRPLTRTRRLIYMPAVMAFVFCAIVATDARAACTSGPSNKVSGAAKVQFLKSATAAASAAPDSNDRSIVGLWHVTFFVGDGPVVWDQGFEQWHSDGTELAVDNAVPPLLGNVCIGIWKAVAPKTIKLRHVTWNWNPDGTLAGTFLLLATVTVDRDGDAFSGDYVSDSFDTAGVVIPALHAEGKMRGERITVD
jgi:hypothetical protein